MVKKITKNIKNSKIKTLNNQKSYFNLNLRFMSRPLIKKISPKLRKELLKEFYDFVASLDREETEEFFNKFLTPGEKIVLSRRLRIAKMLLQGYTTKEIREKLKVGGTTIQFVQKVIEDELERIQTRQDLPFEDV